VKPSITVSAQTSSLRVGRLHTTSLLWLVRWAPFGLRVTASKRTSLGFTSIGRLPIFLANISVSVACLLHWASLIAQTTVWTSSVAARWLPRVKMPNAYIGAD